MKFVHVVPLFTRSDTEVFEYFRDRHDEIDVMTGATVLVELPQTISKDETQDILAGLESGRFAGLTWTELPCLWFEDGEGHDFVQPLPATRPALSKLLRAIAVEAPKASSLAALQRVLPITEEPPMTTRVAVSLTIAFALLLVLLLIGFVWMLPRIHTYGTVAPVFAIYAVIGLLAAVVTFGILKSTGSLRGNAFGTAIEFGGAAAIFVAVIIIGMGYENRVTDFVLTLYFVAPNTHTRMGASGTVALNLPGMPIPSNVNGGFATFPKVASSLKGQSFGINAELTGYHVVGSSDIVIGDQPIYVPVALDVPPATPPPSRYQGPAGYFERLPDKSWVEHVSDQKGAQTINTAFSFAEYQRDQSYVYLSDTMGRARDGDVSNVFLVRLPLHGGFAQASWSKSIDWQNLYVVQPVSSDGVKTALP